MDIHRTPGVGGDDFRRRSEAWDLIDLNNGEALSEVCAGSQVGERQRDGAGAVDFGLEQSRTGHNGVQDSELLDFYLFCKFTILNNFIQDGK